MRPRVYISGPLTNGGKVDSSVRMLSNVFNAMRAAYEVTLAGYAPLNPMLTYFAHEHGYKHEWGVWIDVDLSWVEVSQAVLRLPGESSGADAECEHARKCGVPVVTSIEELARVLPKENTRETVDSRASGNVTLSSVGANTQSHLSRAELQRHANHMNLGHWRCVTDDGLAWECDDGRQWWFEETPGRGRMVETLREYDYQTREAKAPAATSESILAEADRIAGQVRSREYDHPLPNHERIAAIWSVVLGQTVTAEQAALCMIGLKLARLSHNIAHKDSLVDIAGYVKCLDMIGSERARRATVLESK